MTETNQETLKEQNKSRDRPMPIRYVFAALVMLFLLVMAIVLPDVLPYLAPTFGLSAPSSIGAAQQTGSAVSQNPNTNLFESYARLVTLLLALVSVLGVFFGYFVRKSIRETEEELDKRFDRNMALWEKERDELLKKYADDAAQLKNSLEAVADLEKRLREASNEWDAAKEHYKRSPSPAATDVAQASSQLDAQLQTPGGAS